MLLRAILSLFLIPAMIAVAAGASANPDLETDPPKLFEPASETLENGLQVVVIEDHRAPVVTQMVWYKAGAADEAPLKSGIAHFLEHLMFKGTKKVGNGEFSKIVARNGGRDNAFTSLDYTAYYQTAAADKLPLLMELEADRMVNLVLNDDVVGPELQVVLEERSMRTDNNPAALFREQVSAALFLAHPYGVPVIGWRHEIAKLTTKDAIDWYKKYYAPNNAVLVVAGDVEAKAVFDLARKYYGPLKRKSLPPRIRPADPPHLAARNIEMFDQHVRQPSFSRRYLIAQKRLDNGSDGTAGRKLGPVLDVLAEILSGGVTSRIYQALVIEGKIASNAGAYYSGGNLDADTFGLYGSPVAGRTLDDIEQALDRIIDELLREGVSDAEITKAKRSLIADAIYARDSVRGAANMFGAALTSGESIDDVVNWPLHVSKVSKSDVNAAAKLIFDIRRSVSARLSPAVSQE